jgi:dTDP-4-dehydrorhamnose reductase
MKPRILLTGKNGQVGSELAGLLPSVGELTAVGRSELDLAKPHDIRRVIAESRPNLIINAAAYTAVDQAEREEPLARAINADAPAVIAEEAKKIGALVIHYSTDYVFDGAKRTPYTESDPTNPLSAYGRTKLAGEEAIRASGVAHLILRTAWVYSTSGKNFLLTILRLASTREDLRVVNDQFGAPTSARTTAQATTRIFAPQEPAPALARNSPAVAGSYGYSAAGGSAELPRVLGPASFRGKPREKSIDEKRPLALNPVPAQHPGPWSFLAECTGTYHLTAAGVTTWYEFALAILDALQNKSRIPPDTPWFAAATSGRPIIAKRIIPIPTKEYPTPARRPAYSVLSNARFARTFGFSLPDWRAQLSSAIGLSR